MSIAAGTVKDGSPPHLRGKLVICYLDCHRSGITPAPAGKTKKHQILDNKRITPAPAGKTQLYMYRSSPRPDHPRTCGENLLSSLLSSPIRGSPPHLRGKRSLFEMSQEIQRITPAPAGKTKIVAAAIGACADHPRTCGENQI